uniref:Spermatogenesis-associated protein 6 N-terminal domain-containing protein n=1 Tax=Oryzias sinensis TaxID=183150 RepID=A0A8C7Y9R5_9TELE
LPKRVWTCVLLVHVQVSCPGVHRPAKEDVYLSVFVTGQYHQSECLPAVFPLLFQEKMTFEKVRRKSVCP